MTEAAGTRAALVAQAAGVRRRIDRNFAALETGELSPKLAHRRGRRRSYAS
ncbi:MAG: hypothetical protein ACYDCI_11900 [Candidatus Limnocylindrales bacterium]